MARCRCDDANLSGGIAEALPQELRLHRLEKRGVTRYARYVTALLFHYRGALQGAVRHFSRRDPVLSERALYPSP